MITMEDRSDLVHFEHDGVKYAMTEQEIEAAYRYQEHQYRLRDAKRHLNILVFGHDDESDFNGPEHQEEKDRFFWEYGIKYEDAISEDMLETYLRRFKDQFDCNYDENSWWEAVISAVL